MAPVLADLRAPPPPPPPPGLAIDTSPTSAAGTSPCHTKNCPGDYNQVSCGYLNQSTGIYYADVYVDVTFANSITLTTLTESSRYGYTGCFNLGTSALLQPASFHNQFTSTSAYYSLCAGLAFPFTAIQYQTGTLGDGFT